MYCEFFNLKQLPFSNTADPHFFFETAEHEEALAALFYGVTQQRGIILVTGSPGTGKTLLAHALVKGLRSQAQTALLLHTPENGHELIAGLCRGFDVRHRTSHTTGELVERLRAYLNDRFCEGKSAVAIIDEAQNMSMETLEHLRMLENLEKESSKLLQIVLLGQPEFAETIKTPSMQQFRQRIFCHRKLQLLARDQTRHYLLHRLKMAGAEDVKIFSDQAIDYIHDLSGGLPRLINQIADNAMLAAYSAGNHKIDRTLVENSIKDMMGMQLMTSETDTVAPSVNNATQTSASVCPTAVTSSPVLYSSATGESIRQGAEIAGRLTEVNRNAQQQRDDLKSLLAHAQRATEALSHAQQASVVMKSKASEHIKEFRRLTKKAEGAAQRLQQTHSTTEHVTKQLSQLVRQAEKCSGLLAGNTPKAKKSLEDSISKAQKTVTEVTETIQKLNLTAQQADDFKELLKHAQQVTVELNQAQKASVTTQSMASKNIEAFRHLSSEAEEASQRLQVRHVATEELTSKLSQLVRQAEVCSELLTSDAPEAKKMLEEKIEQAKMLVTDVTNAINDLSAVAQQTDDFKELLKHAEQVTVELNQAQEASVTTQSMASKHIEAFKRLSSEAEEASQRLQDRHVATEELTSKLSQLVRQAEVCSELLASNAPEAKAELEEKIEHAKTVVTDVTNAINDLSAVAQQADDIKELLKHAQQATVELNQAQEASAATQSIVSEHLQEFRQLSQEAKEDAQRLQQSHGMTENVTNKLSQLVDQAEMFSELLASNAPEAKRALEEKIDQAKRIVTDVTDAISNLCSVAQQADISKAEMQTAVEQADARRQQLEAASFAVNDQTANIQELLSACQQHIDHVQALMPKADCLADRLEGVSGGAQQQTDDLKELLTQAQQAKTELQDAHEASAATRSMVSKHLQEFRQLSQEAKEDAQRLQQSHGMTEEVMNKLSELVRQAEVCSELLTSDAPEAKKTLEEKIEQTRTIVTDVTNAISNLCAAAQQADISKEEMQSAVKQADGHRQKLEAASSIVIDQTANVQGLLTVCQQHIDRVQQLIPEANNLVEHLDGANRNAQQKSEDLKGLFVHADQTSTAINRAQQAVASTRSKICKHIKEFRRLSNEAKEDAQRLQQSHGRTEEVTNKLGLLVRQAEMCSELLASDAPEAKKTLEQKIEQAKTIVTDVTEVINNLCAVAQQADISKAEIQTVAGEADENRQRLEAASSAVSEQTTNIQELLSACQQHIDHVQALMPKADCLADRLEGVSGNAQQQTDDLKELLTQAEQAKSELQHAQEASTETRSIVSKHLQEFRQLSQEAKEDTQRLRQSHGMTEDVTSKLSQLVRQAETFSELLASDAPEAKKALEDSISKAQEMVTEAVDTISQLTLATQQTNELKGLLTQADHASGALNQAQMATASARSKISENIKEFRRLTQEAKEDKQKLQESHSATAELTGKLSTLVSQADVCSRLLATGTPEAKKTLEESIGKAQQAMSEVMDTTTQLSAATELANTANEEVQTTVEQADGSRRKLEAISSAVYEQHEKTRELLASCGQHIHQIEALIPEADGMADRLDGVKCSAGEALAFYEKQMAELQKLLDQLPGQVNNVEQTSNRAQQLQQSLDASNDAAQHQLTASKEMYDNVENEVQTLESYLRDTQAAYSQLTEVHEKLKETFSAQAIQKLEEARDKTQDMLDKAGIVEADGVRRIEEMTEGIGQVTELLKQLGELSQHAENLRTSLGQRTVNALQRAGELEEKLDAKAQGVKTQIDEAQETISNLNELQNTLKDRVDAQSESLRQEIDHAKSAKSQLETLRSELTESMAPQAWQILQEQRDKTEAMLEKAAEQSQQLQLTTQNAQNAGSRATQTVNEQSEALQRQVDQVASVRSQLDALRSELTESLAPKVWKTLQEQRDKTEAMLNDASEQCRQLQMAAQNAQETGATITDTVDEQIAKLHDNACQASQAMSQHVGQLHKEIDTQTEVLRQQIEKAQKAQSELDTLRSELNESLSPKARQTLQEQRDKTQALLEKATKYDQQLQAATQNAYDASAKVKEVVDGQIARLDETANRTSHTINEQAEDLNQQIDRIKSAKQELDTLRSELTESLAPQAWQTLQAQRDETAAMLDQAAQQREQLNLATQNAQEAGDQITQTVDKQVARLYKNTTQTADAISDQMADLQQKIEQVEAAKDELNKLKSELTDSTAPEAWDALQEQRRKTENLLGIATEHYQQLQQATQNAQETGVMISESVDSHVAKLRETTSQTSQAIHAQIEALNKKIDTQSDAVRQQIDQVEAARIQLDQLRAELSESLSSEAWKNVQEQRSQTEALLNQATQQCEQLHTATQNAHGAGEKVTETVDGQIDRLQEHTNQTSQAICEQVTNLNQRIEQAKATQSQLDVLRNELTEAMAPEAWQFLQAQRDKTELLLSQATKQYEQLESVTKNAQDAGEKVAETVKGQIDKVDEHIRRVSEAISEQVAGFHREIAPHRSALQQQIRQAEDATSLLDTLRSELTESLAPQAWETLQAQRDQTEAMLEKASQQSQQLQQDTLNAHDASAKVTKIVDSQIARLQENTSQSSRAIREQVDNLHRDIEQMSQTINDRLAEVASISSAIETKAAQLDSSTQRSEQARQKLDEAAQFAATQNKSTKQAADQAEDCLNRLAQQIEAADRRGDRLTVLNDKLNASFSPEVTQVLDERCTQLEQLIKESAALLGQIKNESDQLDHDHQEKLETLTGNLGRAVQRSEHLEGVIQQADKFKLEVAQQTIAARQAKQDLEKLLRRLARERAQADSSLEGLRHERSVSEEDLHISIMPAISEKNGSGDQKHAPTRQDTKQSLDILEGIRQAMEAPLQPIGKN